MYLSGMSSICHVMSKHVIEVSSARAMPLPFVRTELAAHASRAPGEALVACAER
jgi:hypothetical protein